jgi:hypothetical protein
MSIHQQVWVKVNTQVDSGIAELIQALSSFPGLRTLESCESGSGSAWVCFDYGDCGWRPLAECIFGLIGPKLIAAFGDRVCLSLGIAESGEYRAEMTVNKSIISAVSEAVKQMSVPAKAD